MKYRDYYEILGVSRDATPEQIRKAFRTLARRHHPDANKGDPQSSEKFKEISEAYEVLKDEKKRKLYDQLGPDWKSGQDFTPPPGWGGRGRAPYVRTSSQGMPEGFSEFFESLFGGARSGGFRGGFPGGFGGFETGFNGGQHEHAADAENEITVPLEKVMAGGSVSLRIDDGSGTPRGIEVTIPKGIGDGKRIRLSGQAPGGGDLYLRIRIDAGRSRVEGSNVIVPLPITPWEAALGGPIVTMTPEGESITLTIPPGTSTGRRLRLRGKGLNAGDGARGDLYFEASIQMPKSLTDAERTLFEKLKSQSTFNPRTPA